MIPDVDFVGLINKLIKRVLGSLTFGRHTNDKKNCIQQWERPLIGFEGFPEDK